MLVDINCANKSLIPLLLCHLDRILIRLHTLNKFVICKIIGDKIIINKMAVGLIIKNILDF